MFYEKKDSQTILDMYVRPFILRLYVARSQKEGYQFIYTVICVFYETWKVAQDIFFLSSLVCEKRISSATQGVKHQRYMRRMSV